MKKLLLIFMLLYAACTSESPHVGITDSDNFLKGTLTSESGESINGATVVLYKKSETSLAKKLSTTDTVNITDLIAIDSIESVLGEFQFMLNEEGIYSLQAFRNDSLISQNLNFSYTLNMNVDMVVKKDTIAATEPEENREIFASFESEGQYRVGSNEDENNIHIYRKIHLTEGNLPTLYRLGIKVSDQINFDSYYQSELELPEDEYIVEIQSMDTNKLSIIDKEITVSHDSLFYRGAINILVKDYVGDTVKIQTRIKGSEEWQSYGYILIADPLEYFSYVKFYDPVSSISHIDSTDMDVVKVIPQDTTFNGKIHIYDEYGNVSQVEQNIIDSLGYFVELQSADESIVVFKDSVVTIDRTGLAEFEIETIGEVGDRVKIQARLNGKDTWQDFTYIQIGPPLQ